ncbi:MAG: peptidase MA family metallohydrolase [Nitrospira sp.]
MYRRDISHTLRLLMVGLGIFVLYHTWIKPTYLTKPAPAPAPAPMAPIVDHPPMDGTVTPPDLPATRLIDPGDAPSGQLGLIREDLDRGNYKKVESALRKLSRTALNEPPSKQYAAALWNNLGVQQEKFGGIELSVKAFKQALALAPEHPVILSNATQAYWGLRDPALTPDFLQTAIRVAPNDPFPRLALADILIERGDTAAATDQLTATESQAKQDPNLRSYYQRLVSRIELTPAASVRVAQVPSPASQTARTAPQTAPPSSPPTPARTNAIAAIQPSAPPTPPPAQPELATPPPATGEPQPATTTPQPTPGASRSTEHFLVRYDGKEAPDAWTQIRSILEYAHQDMSQKFGHMPTKPFPVVLHTNQPFATEADTPALADNLFDDATGTIHIPTAGALEDLGLLSRVVRHQFAHALIHEKLGTQKQAVPIWLAEGLSLHLAEDPWPALDDVKNHPLAVMPLQSLQSRWKSVPKESLPAAYHESFLATQHLLDRYNMYGVRQVLNGLQVGLSFDAALQQKLSLTVDAFSRQWQATVQTASGPKR